MMQTFWRLGAHRCLGATRVLCCLFGVNACGDDNSEAQLLKLTQTCALNSECEEPLVCAFERCHVACETDRDCEGQGGRCVRTDDGEGRVCQFEDSVECERDKDCEGKQICAVDNTCRDLCDNNAECGEDQICAENDNVCAQSEEVNEDGELGTEPDDSNDDDSSNTDVRTDAGKDPETETDTPTTDPTQSEPLPNVPDAGDEAQDASLPATTEEATAETAVDAGGEPTTDETNQGTETDEPDWVEPTECIERGNVGLHFSFQQLVQLPESSAFTTDDFTWELWARFASVDTNYFLSKGDSYAIWYQDGALRAVVNGPTDNIMSNEWLPEPGRWYHLALSYQQSSHKQRLYVDGELAVSATVEGDVSYDASPVILGGYQDAQGTAIANFGGDIDQVIVWPSARSAEEVQQDMTLDEATLPDGAAGVWYFDDGEGQTATELSGEAIDGVLGVNGEVDAADPTWVPVAVSFGAGPSAGLCGDGECERQTNRALYFGEGHVVQSPPAQWQHLEQFTIKTWVNFRGVYSGASHSWILVGKPYGNEHNDSFAIWHSSNNTDTALRAYVGLGADYTLETQLDYPWIPEPGRWYQVAFSFDSATGDAKLYLDDDLVASETFAAAPPLYDDNPLYLGAETNNGQMGGFLPGQLDELKVWNRVLSLDEIIADQSDCSTDTSEDLIGYWPFDEAHGTRTVNVLDEGQVFEFGAANYPGPSWVASTAPFAE